MEKEVDNIVQIEEKKDNVYFCPKCGSQVNNNYEFCPKCGTELLKSSTFESNIEKDEAKGQTAKLIIGIISFVLFAFVSFQSCAVSLATSLGNGDNTSAGCGAISALCFCVAGIIALVARKQKTKTINYVCSGFYWAVYFFSRFGMKDYPDLEFWGYISFAFGCVFILTVAKTKKEKIISVIACSVYLVLGLL